MRGFWNPEGLSEYELNKLHKTFYWFIKIMSRNRKLYKEIFVGNEQSAVLESKLGLFPSLFSFFGIIFLSTIIKGSESSVRLSVFISLKSFVFKKLVFVTIVVVEVVVCVCGCDGVVVSNLCFVPEFLKLNC